MPISADESPEATTDLEPSLAKTSTESSTHSGDNRTVRLITIG